jgi:hypothetical protein
MLLCMQQWKIMLNIIQINSHKNLYIYMEIGEQFFGRVFTHNVYSSLGPKFFPGLRPTVSNRFFGTPRIILSLHFCTISYMVCFLQEESSVSSIGREILKINMSCLKIYKFRRPPDDMSGTDQTDFNGTF